MRYVRNCKDILVEVELILGSYRQTGTSERYAFDGIASIDYLCILTHPALTNTRLAMERPLNLGELKCGPYHV